MGLEKHTKKVKGERTECYFLPNSVYISSCYYFFDFFNFFLIFSPSLYPSLVLSFVLFLILLFLPLPYKIWGLIKMMHIKVLGMNMMVTIIHVGNCCKRMTVTDLVTNLPLYTLETLIR